MGNFKHSCNFYSCAYFFMIFKERVTPVLKERQTAEEYYHISCIYNDFCQEK